MGEKTVHELLREKGIDPELDKGKPGLFLDWHYQTGDIWRKKAEGYQTPHSVAYRNLWLSPEGNRLFENGDATAVWIYPTCTEHKGDFADWWWGMPGYIANLMGAESAWAPPYIASGRFFLEPYARALAVQDAKQIYAGAWSHCYPGQENLLREFAMEYRALPKKTFESVPGEGDYSVVVRTLGDHAQTYVYAVNTSWYPATAALSLEGPADELRLQRITNGQAVELAAGQRTDTKEAAISLQPYQLMSFELTPAGAHVTGYTARSGKPGSDYVLPFRWRE